jgi:hypothetical protein
VLTSREREVVQAVVAALLPGFPPLDGAAREQVVRDVAGFLGSQIGAMPATLRAPYRIALAAFGLLPLFRYGRTSTRLDADTRAAWLELWGERGGLPTRSFVKLLRSCALLAYFDHSLVTEKLAAAARPGRRLERRGFEAG